MYLPTLGDKIDYQLDIILVTGDAYIDHPSMGSSLIAHRLVSKGYKVGIIAQPDLYSNKDICWFGQPKLFWGVTSGAVDSIVANYTALGKKRKSDNYTPGGTNNKRPDRATIFYSNLIRKYYKKQTIVLGGLEAGLRRLAHYDWIQDKLRRSVLIDSKADYLLYGMADNSVVQFADLYKEQKFDDIKQIRGICFKDSNPDLTGAIKLPDFETVLNDRKEFFEFYKIFSENFDYISGKKLVQKFDKTFVVQNPPAIPLTSDELDEVYSMDFERNVHPFYLKQGKVKAIETVKFSVVSHRGCYGNCSFCSITAHQGNYVVSRSEKSIIKEIEKIGALPDFKGYISDVGGPTANMYSIECEKKQKFGACLKKDCLVPKICPNLKVNHDKYLFLLKKIQNLPFIKKVFISSGIRFDLLLADKNFSVNLKQLINNHISGQLKIAPEHLDNYILSLMNKSYKNVFFEFIKNFEKIKSTKIFWVCYLMVGHPGSSIKKEQETAYLVKKIFNYNPEQIQVFTPTPSTWSTTMYYTGMDKNKRKINIIRKLSEKRRLKELFLKPTKMYKNKKKLH
jgi:uncharacterized radical SAM protein YgiQ